MLFRSSTLILATILALAGTILGAPVIEKRGQSIIIGYRYVEEKTAKTYNQHKTLTQIAANGVQLGEGAYISPALGQWPVPADRWHCVILADQAKLAQVKKLYITPKSGNHVLFYNPTNLNAYIAKAQMDPKKTILFSVIKGLEPAQQMLLPPAFLKGALGASIDIGLHVTCKPQHQSIGSAVVDWSKWHIPGWTN
jgi:hypothetical protein